MNESGADTLHSRKDARVMDEGVMHDNSRIALLRRGNQTARHRRLGIP